MPRPYASPCISVMSCWNGAQPVAHGGATPHTAPHTKCLALRCRCAGVATETHTHTLRAMQQQHPRQTICIYLPITFRPGIPVAMAGGSGCACAHTHAHTLLSTYCPFAAPPGAVDVPAHPHTRINTHAHTQTATHDTWRSGVRHPKVSRTLTQA